MLIQSGVALGSRMFTFFIVLLLSKFCRICSLLSRFNLSTQVRHNLRHNISASNALLPFELAIFALFSGQLAEPRYRFCALLASSGINTPADHAHRQHDPVRQFVFVRCWLAAA